jgi:Bifunctional DNA primase/polymerase, N-terminal
MSAFIKKPFASVAPYLADYGYHPVPIKPGCKAPLLDGWQNPKRFRDYLPNVNPETGKRTDCGSWGTGILTVNCPAIDLDIRNRELVRVLIELLGEMLGPSPFRVGAPPKALLPFSTSTPFDKISGRWWGLPGDNWRSDCYSPHRIEILGKGQQFVAYARHPRGTLYRWCRGEPTDIHRADLPEINDSTARAFVAAAEHVFIQVGAVPLRRQNKKWFPDTEQPKQTSDLRSNLSAPIDAAWQRLDPERLAKLIDPQHARRLKDGGWSCSCPAHTSDGHRSLSIRPRHGGGSVVHCFAEYRFVEIAREISAILGRAA